MVHCVYAIRTEVREDNEANEKCDEHTQTLMFTHTHKHRLHHLQTHPHHLASLELRYLNGIRIKWFSLRPAIRECFQEQHLGGQSQTPKGQVKSSTYYNIKVT